MSRATVRAAIATYFEGYGVQQLGTIYEHPPKLTSEGDFVSGADPGTSSGAVVYIHFIEDYEQRVSIGPPGPNPTPARKKVVYTVGLICVFRSKLPDTQDVGQQNDDFLDSMKDAIRANRMAGTNSATPTDGNPPGDGSGTIFQWGEGAEGPGEPDIHVKAGMPKTIRGQVSQVFSTMDVTVIELVAT